MFNFFLPSLSVSFESEEPSRFSRFDFFATSVGFFKRTGSDDFCPDFLSSDAVLIDLIDLSSFFNGNVSADEKLDSSFGDPSLLSSLKITSNRRLK